MNIKLVMMSFGVLSMMNQRRLGTALDKNNQGEQLLCCHY